MSGLRPAAKGSNQHIKAASLRDPPMSSPRRRHTAEQTVCFYLCSCVESRSRRSTAFPDWIIMVCLLCWGSLEPCLRFSAAREEDQRVIRFFFSYTCIHVCLKWNRFTRLSFASISHFLWTKMLFLHFPVNWTGEIRDENVFRHWRGKWRRAWAYQSLISSRYLSRSIKVLDELRFKKTDLFWDVLVSTSRWEETQHERGAPYLSVLHHHGLLLASQTLWFLFTLAPPENINTLFPRALLLVVLLREHSPQSFHTAFVW